MDHVLVEVDGKATEGSCIELIAKKKRKRRKKNRKRKTMEKKKKREKKGKMEAEKEQTPQHMPHAQVPSSLHNHNNRQHEQ